MILPMPGSSYQGKLPPLTTDEQQLKANLEHHIHVLATEIGDRNYLNPAGLTAAAQYLSDTWQAAGYTVERQRYRAKSAGDQAFENLIVEIPGCDRKNEIIIIGGHYDSVSGCPAANDNGSGSAATLELALRLKNCQPSRTLRFVQFVNEEPPFFQSDEMGSLVYARQCQANQDNIVAMLSLETMGYYSDDVGSQQYPIPLGQIYPLQGNFIGFVGNLDSANLVRRVVKLFREQAQFPSEGSALPGMLTGVGWSDHWAFWQCGYPALMVTDTAPFRYPYYHTPEDTPDKIDFDRFTRVVAGLERVILALANEK